MDLFLVSYEILEEGGEFNYYLNYLQDQQLIKVPLLIAYLRALRHYAEGEKALTQKELRRILANITNIKAHQFTKIKNCQEQIDDLMGFLESKLE